MEYRRILAIGDMHGHFTRLLSLIHKVNFDPSEDLLILLGDYIDRGEENMRCLRWAMEMSEKENVIALRGNHEQMMLYYYLLEGREGGIWLPNGGKYSKLELEAWVKREPDALQRALEFIKQRPLYHRLFANGKEYIFCHAGLKPGVALEEQVEDDLLWIREEFYTDYHGTAEVIVGHTPTPYFDISNSYLLHDKPNEYYPLFLKNHITIIDTGSFLPKGRISCIDILSGQVWQSDPDFSAVEWRF